MKLCSSPVTRDRKISIYRLQVKRSTNSSGCYLAFMTDMRMISKFEFACRIETNARSGWEIAALREYFNPYIVQEPFHHPDSQATVCESWARCTLTARHVLGSPVLHRMVKRGNVSSFPHLLYILCSCVILSKRFSATGSNSN